MCVTRQLQRAASTAFLVLKRGELFFGSWTAFFLRTSLQLIEFLPCMLLGLFCCLFFFSSPFSQFPCEIWGPRNIVLQARARLSFVYAGFIK